MAHHISAGDDSGVVIGQDAEDKIAFFGATPAVQAALTVIGALTAGETTPADIAAALVELYDELVAKGLVA